jgi:hypothetical protein
MSDENNDTQPDKSEIEDGDLEPVAGGRFIIDPIDPTTGPTDPTGPSLPPWFPKPGPYPLPLPYPIRDPRVL